MSRMKHVKLFEEFVYKNDLYVKIKDLPIPNGASYYFVNSTDELEISTIEKELRSEGFQEDETIENIINNKVAIVWYAPDPGFSEYWFRDEPLIGNNSNWMEVNFEDHFKLKPEFRGHKLRKYNV